ncbi:hypothetical protein B0H16DRAFT_261482 [Mycena metata]|uniref:Uncharacterized protein n=1 Tax=Mycena metata TaxID=1033252 RepID=A0AAD7HTC1_9AGAR|nr:hypothetical protein B0H16DRAFT_261482 [Mycena metata]
MSSLSFLLSKSGVRPMVALVGAGIKVALLVASKSPSIPSSAFEASPTRIVHPTKASPTRLHQPDVSFSLSFAVASTVALFGLVGFVLASKGFLSGTRSNDGRDGEDPPEPDGDADEEDHRGPVNEHDNDDTNGDGEEPPPPPDAGAIDAVPRQRWNWMLWLMLILILLSCYYWREISVFVISFVGERKLYYTVAYLIGRSLSHFINPALFQFISSMVIDFLLYGKMPSWLPTSITTLTAMSTAYSALLFLNVIFRVCRVIVNIPRAVYKSIAFIHRGTRRCGRLHYLIWLVWLYLALACKLCFSLMVICAYGFPQTQVLVARWINVCLDSVLRSCWPDDLSFVQNITTVAAPVALFIYRST